MLLYFLITCFSFIFLFKSFPLKPLPPWASEIRLLSLCFWKQVSIFSISNFTKNTLCRFYIPSTKKMGSSPQVEATNEDSGMTVLDLPELTLECILERLPPSGLCSMAGVCSSLRERCVSNHLWEKHMKQKWGGLMGPAAHREWQWYLACRDSANLRQGKQRGLTRLLSIVWPFWWVGSRVVDSTTYSKQTSYLPVDSIMSWYLALETGKFWFPAQVYNRENGHVGFMLSCYDAELSYDPRTDTFQARYPPHGRRAIAIETNVPWERLRAPPVDSSPHDLHISDCLNELCPGDHIEIQWRRNKEFPYGWWYGVVGHLESCDGNETYCRCHNNDTVALEFNHYTPGSRWRRTTISRKEHREEGNEADGFYGGIRKLKSNEEISIWRRLWPVQVLE
ncbi:F-box protein At2g32560-like isoform X1 [Tripterygium wilfordii]|uniref:F-box protein At2g32560-like isoform X1 n=1 Tax=Tripterygium wilfordii TaxID=458696 RepID=UPI0018F7F1ED|nr:F-box protein At2g32560-like isoform X1 [Tripterygium wilfordii]